MKQIPVGDTVAFVDDEDYPLISKYRWVLHSDGYAVSKYGPKQRRRHIFMHRLIMQPNAGKIVDHRDDTKRLDNRRQNLRVCTHPQNHGNSVYKSARKTSRFKGVGFLKASGKWRARTRRIVEGRIVENHLGLFDDEIDAAKAYDAAARQYFGEFARLNF